MEQIPTARRRAPRSDAKRHREALLAAATSIFHQKGYDVALEEIAEGAGVSRGTLYRNFKDRQALALAIFSREVDKFEDEFDPNASITDTLSTMVRKCAPFISLYRRIAPELHRPDFDPVAFERLRDRLEQVVGPAVEKAHQRGELAKHTTPSDVILAMQMAGGLIYPFMPDAAISEQISWSLRLLLQGMQPR